MSPHIWRVAICPLLFRPAVLVCFSSSAATGLPLCRSGLTTRTTARCPRVVGFNLINALIINLPSFTENPRLILVGDVIRLFGDLRSEQHLHQTLLAELFHAYFFRGTHANISSI